MLDLNMFRDIAVMVRFVFAQVTVIPKVVVSTLNMRVQYGCLNSFIVAMVTFEELFRIMSGIWVIFEYFLSSKNDEINDILTLQCILKVYFDVFFIKRNKVFSSY